MQESLRFSVIIANYNYARFVSRAIDSALGIAWPNVEVIVVDDGSTDDSRQFIELFGDRITAIFQNNAGQLSANNVGFAAAAGDIIIFLDADDVLTPSIASEIAAIWSERISKVQVQMRKVDELERPLKSILPQLLEPPSPQSIRRWATVMNEYPTPPGSGNAYARTFLNRLFPLGKDRDSSTDTTCIAMAPFLGEVATILRPLVLYRMHGGNDSNLLTSEANFGREVQRGSKRLKAAQDACAMEGLDPPATGALRRGSHLLQLRAASLRLRPDGHPLPGDTRLAVLTDAALLPLRGGFEPFGRRLMIAAYAAFILLTPLAVARILIRMRFAQS